MAIPFITSLPVRLPVPQNDMAGMLGSWLDNSPGLGLSSADCRTDLENIDRLRRDIAQSLMGEKKLLSESDVDFQLGVIEKLHEYYHFLLECEEHGMVRAGGGDDQSSSSTEYIALEWEAAISTSGPLQTQLVDSIESERANVMWSLAALQVDQASKENLTTKLGWTKASKSLQNAASWLGHLLVLLQKEVVPTRKVDFGPEMSPTFVLFWQALLVAQAQHCDYESRCVKRPVHQLVAKLAAAAVPLYGEVEGIVQNENNSSVSTSAFPQYSDIVSKMTHFARAWGAYMSYKAEYHQSQIHRGKKDCGQELARLEKAYQKAIICKTVCEDSPSGMGLEQLDGLRTAIDEEIELLRSHVDTAERENQEIYKQNIPKLQELPEIRGSKTVKCDEPLSKLLRPKTTEPIFQRRSNNVAGSSEADNIRADNNNYDTVVKNFRIEMTTIISELAHATEDHTESARLALAEMQLPQSLTAFKQEQSGGGLPEDLWQRVEIIQEENKLLHLKQNLWALKDAADLARALHKEIEDQLKHDVDRDREFREANPSFKGHNTGELQASFLIQLETHDKLLSSAHQGDSVVFQRLEQLDNEPKYNLVQCPKSQLDRLLPGAKCNAENSEIAAITQHLSDLLGDLSTLFQERDELMNIFQKELDNFDIVGALKSKVDSMSGSDSDYLEAMKHSQRAFDTMRYAIHENMTRQDEILGTIFSENERFMNFREQTANSQSADSCIVMIEEAIAEIEQLSKDSNDGKKFYNVVIPKLNDLKDKVIDVSARLEIERCDYCEEERRAKQEEKDALMAKKLSAVESSTISSNHQQTADEGSISASAPARTLTSTISSNNNTSSGALGSTQGQSPSTTTNEIYRPSVSDSQGTMAASHQAEAISHIDDEKVATLVAMEFDATRVVAALEKYDNDMNKALNELLSC